MQAWKAPVRGLLGSQEVLVDRSQLDGQRRIEQLDDTVKRFHRGLTEPWYAALVKFR